MSADYVPAPLRRLVHERAEERCEYCRIHQDIFPYTHEIDHLVARKHGGQTIAENLALACIDCNRNKGSDLTSIDPITQRIFPLFNPRVQLWESHFVLEGAQIVGLTPIGRATVFLLKINDSTRISTRAALMTAGDYP